MGNSEVGHLNLGAGAVVKQDLVRIDEAVEDGSLAENEVLLEALRDAPRVHLIGLVSDGGVHSADRHLKALIELAAREGVEDLVIHAFTDGRDTSPTSGAESLADVERWSEEAGGGRIGTVVGRYFAMDRDTRWDRTQKAIDLLVRGQGRAPRRERRGGRRGGLQARRDGRVHDPDHGRRGGAHPPGRLRDRVQLPPRPHAPDHSTALDEGGRRPLHDADRVRGGLALPGGVPARRGPRSRSPRSSPSAARRSCTSPRRRSTRT